MHPHQHIPRTRDRNRRGLHRQHRLIAETGGTLITIAGAPDEAKAAELGIAVHTFVLDSNGPRLAEIAGLIDAGELRPVVTRILDLDEVVQAHPFGKHAWKIVLRVP